MSNSRSPTPQHTNSPTNRNPSTSRTRTHDDSPSARPSPADRSDSPTHARASPHSHYFQDPVPSISGGIRQLPRRPVSPIASADQPMSKRLRRASPRPRSRTSSSESQGGMADTEEASHDHSGTTPPAANPQKKKRTRTLTTPHQSAVLHALLAQSRFPTTAMREEVGRSIGLSARKVQIWFQNQRQKARRPRTQGEIPLTRPPQYGPYPASGESVALRPAPGESGQSSSSPTYRHYSRGGYPSSYAPFSESFHSPTESLLGPGMPGSSRYISQSPQRSPIDDRFHHSSPVRARPYPDPFVQRRASPPSRRPSETDLPPVRRVSETEFLGPVMPFDTSRGPGGRPYVLHRTPSPSLILPPPPPFPIQPQSHSLQWDAPRLAPLISPRFDENVRLSPLRHNFDEPITLPPISARPITGEPSPSRSEQPYESPRPRDPSPPRPAGRYDPVRATVIPYRRDPMPPPPPL